MPDENDFSPAKFAAEVDRLGAEGKSQDEIATALGLSKSQVRWRLLNSGYTWNAETRVRIAATGQRLDSASPTAPAA